MVQSPAWLRPEPIRVGITEETARIITGQEELGQEGKEDCQLWIERCHYSPDQDSTAGRKLKAVIRPPPVSWGGDGPPSTSS